MSGTNLSPEDYNWVKAAMDGPHLQRTTAITIALASSLDHPRPIPPTGGVEPPPQIDYWLVHSMIRLSERALTDLDRERYDRLSAARKAYYTAHGRFQHAYHGLADAQAFECILYAERSDICAYGEQAEGQWAESERQKALNAWELVRCWQEVRVAMEVRRVMTLQLSREKRAFLERDVRRLAFLCRHAHRQWNANAEAGKWRGEGEVRFDDRVKLVWIRLCMAIFFDREDYILDGPRWFQNLLCERAESDCSHWRSTD